MSDLMARFFKKPEGSGSDSGESQPLLQSSDSEGGGYQSFSPFGGEGNQSSLTGRFLGWGARAKATVVSRFERLEQKVIDYFGEEKYTMCVVLFGLIFVLLFILVYCLLKYLLNGGRFHL